MDDLESGWTEDLTVGVPAEDWHRVPLEPQELIEHTPAALVPLLTGVSEVVLGGYHRDDCVAVVARILGEAGLRVAIDDASTLPYPGMAHTPVIGDPDDYEDLDD